MSLIIDKRDSEMVRTLINDYYGGLGLRRSTP
jgi:hypothetical protein